MSAVCCRELPGGGLDGPCTWPETDCYVNGPKAELNRGPDLDVAIEPRRPAHEGDIATLEDENTRLKAELEILRRRYDSLLAEGNQRRG